MKTTDLAYIAGIIDGEGCIGIVKSRSEYTHVNGVQSIRYRCRITVVNTDPKIITKTSEVCMALGVKFYVRAIKMHGNRRNRFEVQIYSKTAVITFLKAIRPYLVAKREQADTLMKLANQPIHATKSGRSRNIVEAEEICNRLSRMKRFNAPVESMYETPKTGKVMGMMCSDLHSDMQKKAEMPFSSVSNN